MNELIANPANSTPLTPLMFLERAATVYGDCPSVIYNGTEYRWSQTHSRCLRLASSLSSSGIRKGDVVSVLAPNVPAMYELQFAVPMAGAVINNINTRLDPHTIAVLLAHSESKMVFVDCLLRDHVLEAVSLLPSSTNRLPLVLIADANADDGEPERTLDGCFCRTYESMVEGGDPLFEWVRPECEWDPMALNYTSGTTSSPKGVVHCHRGIFTITLSSLLDWSVPNGAVYLWTLPIFHSNGWSFPWGMAAVGGTNICIRKIDAGTIYDMIARHGVTHMCGAPVVLNMLANSPSRAPLKNPVHVIAGGAPPPAAVLHGAEALGFLVSHGYGLTETSGVVVSCAWKPKWNRFPAGERARLKARQGVAVVGFTAMDVLDQNSGKSVKRDGISLGEIVLRGCSVMLGYLKDAEATSRCIKDDGWFYTGDVGVIHPDGYLEIKDRSKDVIISGGENISSVEVESILYSHPAVNEAAVVARPDEYWGETPCAFLSLKTEELTTHVPSQKDVIDFCRGKMPNYMIPKTVVFMQDLPKTSTGKIQKLLLRHIAVTLGSRLYPSRL